MAGTPAKSSPVVDPVGHGATLCDATRPTVAIGGQVQYFQWLSADNPA
jgi:hypothetical protein